MKEPMSGQNRSIFGINKNVLSLGWVSLFTDMSSQMIFPLIPLFLANVLGVGKEVIGLIEGTAESTASILKVFSGWVSDRLRKRKALVFVGYTFSTLSKIIFGFSGVWQHVFMGRFLDRVGKGIRTSPRDALIADAIGRKGRGKYFGFHRMMDRLGAIVGTLLAFVFLTQFHNDFRKVFLISVIPAAIAVLVIIFFVKEKKRIDKGMRKSPQLSLKLVDRRFKIFIIIAVLFALGNFSYAFLILRAQDLGIPAVIIPLVWLLYNITYAFSAIPAGVLSDRHGRRRVLAFGYALFGIVCLGFILAPSAAYAWVLFGLYGVFAAVFESVSRAFASDLASQKIRATALGVYHTSVGLAAFPASLMAGMLWRFRGSMATFSYGATLAFIAALLLLFCLKKGK